MTDSIPFLHKYQIEVGTMDDESGVFTGSLFITSNHIKGKFSTSSKGSGTSPKENFLELYNLDDQTRQALVKKRAYIKVNAGWESLTSFNEPLLLLYSGHVKSVKTTKTNVDIITVLGLEDGLYSKKNTINKTLEKGVTLKRALEVLLKGFLPQLGEVSLSEKKANVRLTRGKTFNGNVSEVLDKMCRAYNLKWYITKNTVKVVDAEELGVNTFTYQIDLSTVKGFIDYSKQNVEIDKKSTEKLEAKVTLQLNPLYDVGETIVLPKPDNVGGETEAEFKITSITHQLDYFGHTWDTLIEAEETGGS